MSHTFTFIFAVDLSYRSQGYITDFHAKSNVIVFCRALLDWESLWFSVFVEVVKRVKQFQTEEYRLWSNGRFVLVEKSVWVAWDKKEGREFLGRGKFTVENQHSVTWLKVCFYLWALMRVRSLATNWRRGENLANRYLFFCSEEETVDHLLPGCNFIQQRPNLATASWPFG